MIVFYYVNSFKTYTKVVIQNRINYTQTDWSAKINKLISTRDSYLCLVRQMFWWQILCHSKFYYFKTKSEHETFFPRIFKIRDTFNDQPDKIEWNMKYSQCEWSLVILWQITFIFIGHWSVVLRERLLQLRYYIAIIWFGSRSRYIP